MYKLGSPSREGESLLTVPGPREQVWLHNNEDNTILVMLIFDSLENILAPSKKHVLHVLVIWQLITNIYRIAQAYYLSEIGHEKAWNFCFIVVILFINVILL